MSLGIQEQEIPGFTPQATPLIEMGTVGWDDRDLHYDLGSGQNDGYTIVCVQLFRGKNPAKRIVDPAIAQGHKILCMLSSSIGRIPPKGTRCFVAMAAGFEENQCSGVLFATVEKNTTQLNVDRALLDYGSQHLVIKAKSVTIMDTDAVHPCYITVGTPRGGGTRGLVFANETGSGGIIQGTQVSWWSTNGGSSVTTQIQIKGTSVELHDISGTHLTMGNGAFYTVATNAYILAGGVYLGRTPIALTPALYGVSGPAGLASGSVYISAT
jgi:hypothetical protein